MEDLFPPCTFLCLWHHWFNGYEFEQIPGDSKGKPGVLQSVGSLSDWTTAIRIHMNSFYPVSYKPLLSLFILMHTLFQLWLKFLSWAVRSSELYLWTFWQHYKGCFRNRDRSWRKPWAMIAWIWNGWNGFLVSLMR